MNTTFLTFQHFMIASSLFFGFACVVAMLVYMSRGCLADLLNGWRRLGRFGQCVTFAMFMVFFVYGSTKSPSSTNEPPAGIEGGSPSTTNEPPTDIEGDPAPTNTPPPMMMGRSRPMMSPPPEQTENEPSATYHSSLIPQTSWNTRGAFCDWLRVDFPSSFAFPSGTNLLTGVTVMAWGELRCNDGALAVGLRQSATTGASSLRIISLPHPVSLEPDASSFVHGLTPSNSYLFTWQNVCVNRDPTNRVDASIELFDSGAIATTVTPLSSPSTSTYTYQPAVPPAGFVGEGQDDDWLATAFPSHYDAITNLGYAAWLDDYIGYNEPNGRYKVSVTVSSMPDHGPCYLVVGPYKMVVTAPGTYSFPLEVFDTYKAYTCPTRVPLSFSYDDGYEIESEPGFFMTGPRLLGRSPEEELEYELRQIPSVTVRPSRIELSQVGNTPIEILCNMAVTSRDYWTSTVADFNLVFLDQTTAQIVYAASECIVQFELRNAKGTTTGSFEIYRDHHCHHEGGTNDVDISGSPGTNTTANLP